MQCNSEYPTPYRDVNLNAMITLKKKFGLNIGFSDHSIGLDAPLAAAAMGAQVIEKHFTLNKNFKGPDHVASLNPEELKIMVISIRNIEKIKGNGIKKPTKSEKKNLKIMRRSIVAKKNILKGEKFTPENIILKRPGNGISGLAWDKVIGKISSKNFKKDKLIKINNKNHKL